MHSSLIIRFKPGSPLVFSWPRITVLRSLQLQNSHWIYHPQNQRSLLKDTQSYREMEWLIRPLLSLFTLGILAVSKYQHQDPSITRFFYFPSSLPYHHQRTNSVITWNTALLTLHTQQSVRIVSRPVSPTSSQITKLCSKSYCGLRFNLWRNLASDVISEECYFPTSTLSKTQPASPLQKSRAPFSFPLFFHASPFKKKGSEPTEIALVPSKRGRLQVFLHLLIVSSRWLFCVASEAQCWVMPSHFLNWTGTTKDFHCSWICSSAEQINIRLSPVASFISLSGSKRFWGCQCLYNVKTFFPLFPEFEKTHPGWP